MRGDKRKPTEREEGEDKFGRENCSTEGL